MKSPLYVVGGCALTINARMDVISDVVIEIQDQNITDVFSQKNFKPPANAKVVDTSDCLVMPGLVNTHNHIAMSLLRGAADDLPLKNWLMEVIFPIERKWGSPEFVYAGSRLSLAELIRTGTTCIQDMYYFEEWAAKAIHEAGVRAVCGQDFNEISGVQTHKERFGTFDSFLEKVTSYPLITPAMAPHSVYGLKPERWKDVVAYAKQRNLRVHMHLAETQKEEDDFLKQNGQSPTQFLEKVGLLDLPVCFAHATCVTQTDIAILGKHRVGIAHNPESNLKLGTRIAPVVELRNAGCPVGLGTDGCASNNNLDLLQEADTAAKLQSFSRGVGVLRAEDVVRMLTIDGAKALGLDDRIGSLEKGKAADLIAIDLNKPHATPLYNPYSHIVYSACGQDVKHSVVNGQVLMENTQLLTLDEQAILNEAKRWAEKISQM